MPRTNRLTSFQSSTTPVHHKPGNEQLAVLIHHAPFDGLPRMLPKLTLAETFLHELSIPALTLRFPSFTILSGESAIALPPVLAVVSEGGARSACRERGTF